MPTVTTDAICRYCNRMLKDHGESPAGPDWVACQDGTDRPVTADHFRAPGPTVTCERCGHKQALPHSIVRLITSPFELPRSDYLPVPKAERVTISGDGLAVETPQQCTGIDLAPFNNMKLIVSTDLESLGSGTLDALQRAVEAASEALPEFEPDTPVPPIRTGIMVNGCEQVAPGLPYFPSQEEPLVGPSPLPSTIPPDHMTRE